jgi:putative DNA primase/helicase
MSKNIKYSNPKTRTRQPEDIKNIFINNCQDNGIEPPISEINNTNNSGFFRWKGSSGHYWGKLFNNSEISGCVCGQYNGAEKPILFKDCLTKNGRQYTELSVKEKQKIDKEIKQAQEAEQKHRQQEEEEKAKKAQKNYANSTDPVPKDFKHAVNHGLTGSDFNKNTYARFNKQYSNIVIPLYDIDEKHWSNQYIYPEKKLINGKETDKIIVGKMQGCFNIIGDINKSDCVYLAEGAATALSVFLATGKPCIFCVDAGNIEPVYKAISKKHSDKKFILAADNDIKKEKEKGINAGREIAEKLNKKYGLLYVLCPVNSDFCDYYKSFVKQGESREIAFEAVRDYINNPKNLTSNKKQRAEKLPDNYFKDQGLIKYKDPNKGEKAVCSDITVKAFTKNSENENYGLLIQFQGLIGKENKQLLIERGLLSSATETHKFFLNSGVKKIHQKNLFCRFLESSEPLKTIDIAEKTGWNKDRKAYVFIDETFTSDGLTEDIIYKDKFNSVYDYAGTLESWKENVCKFTNENPVLIFSFCIVFGGVLAPYLNSAGIGINLYGDSSTGKTTTAKAAASILNGDSSFQSWRVTNNGFEGKAAQTNHSAIILDDISEVNPDDLDKVIYMAINGNGKQRAQKTGAAATLQKWQVNLISTGEFSAADHLKTGSRKKQNAGQAVRLLDMPAADLGESGVFHNKHEFETFSDFSDELKLAAENHYGTALKPFVRAVFKEKKSSLEYIQKETKKQILGEIKEVYGDNIDSQTLRVINSLSCVIVAGELATQAKITTWFKGEAYKACLDMLKLWISQRGGIGNHEIKTTIEAFHNFFATQSSAKFENLETPGIEFKGEKLGYYDKDYIYIQSKQLASLAENLKTNKSTLMKSLKEIGDYNNYRVKKQKPSKYYRVRRE